MTLDIIVHIMVQLMDRDKQMILQRHIRENKVTIVFQELHYIIHILDLKVPKEQQQEVRQLMIE